MKGGDGVALYIRNDIHCELLSAKSKINAAIYYWSDGSFIQSVVQPNREFLFTHSSKSSMLILTYFDIYLPSSVYLRC